MAVFQDLLRPLYLLSLSGYYGILTFLSLLITLQWSVLLSPQTFSQHWFARFWQYFGPLNAANSASVVAPLLATARGRVLDIGPGAGHWLKYYDPLKVSKIFAVEPNTGHHKSLNENARQAGFVSISKFEATSASIEQLHARLGIERGSIDTIVTVQCMCSMEHQAAMIKELYSLLAPGGRWIVYEHVQRSGPSFLRWYQGLLDLAWPIFFGGCSLCRTTGEVLDAVGNWQSSTLGPMKEDSPTTCIPSIIGVLQKAG